MRECTIGDLIEDDTAGFACGKSNLVEQGIVHLRPFNIGLRGELDFTTTYQIPATAVPNGRGELRAGDILFNNTNSADLVGKAAIVEADVSAGFSNHLTRIRVDREAALPKYLLYVLLKLREKGTFTAAATQWVSQAAYRVSDLKKLRICLPPLAEQQRIVEILDRAASIQRLRRVAEEKAREIIPALFVDMFGDPATNPKGWPTTTLDKVAQVDRGKSRHRPRDDKRLYGGDYPFIQTGEVANSGGIIAASSVTYSEFGLAQSKLWPAGTLCVTIAANIAKTGILQFASCFPDSVVGITPGENTNNEYLQAWLGFLQPTLEAQAPQLAQKNINLEILRALLVPMPPKPMQDRFAEMCQRVRATQALKRDGEASAISLQKTLNYHLFAAG